MSFILLLFVTEGIGSQHGEQVIPLKERHAEVEYPSIDLPMGHVPSWSDPP